MCGRCGRQADAAHRASMAEASCSVPCVWRGEDQWAAGEAALGRVLGRVMAFRRWCEPGPATRSPEQQQGAQPGRAEPEPSVVEGVGGLLASYRCHLEAKVGRRVFCLACFGGPEAGQLERFRRSGCGGLRPVGEVPRLLADGLRRGGAVGCCAAAQARLAAGSLAVGGRVGPPGRLVGAGPVGPRGVLGSLLGQALLAAGRAGAARLAGGVSREVPGAALAAAGGAAAG